MDFSTLVSTKCVPKAASLWGYQWLLISMLVWLGMLSPAQAQTSAPSGVLVERTAEQILITTRIGEPLPSAVQDALNKGVALYFVWTAEVQSPRWYFWEDKTHAKSVRTLRLAYQALSGHWRLSWSNDGMPNSGLRNAVHQNHNSLEEAWAAVGRMVNWPVASTTELPPTQAWVVVQFRMDLGLLPRPFQIGLGNQSDWVLERSYRLPVPLVGMTLESRHGR